MATWKNEVDALLLVVLVLEALLEGRGGVVDGSNSGAKFIGVFGLLGASDGDGGVGVEGKENERAWCFRGRGTNVGGGDIGRRGGEDGREEGGREKRLSK